MNELLRLIIEALVGILGEPGAEEYRRTVQGAIALSPEELEVLKRWNSKVLKARDLLPIVRQWNTDLATDIATLPNPFPLLPLLSSYRTGFAIGIQAAALRILIARENLTAVTARNPNGTATFGRSWTTAVQAALLGQKKRRLSGYWERDGQVNHMSIRTPHR